jgi:two-component system catabolic regulation response regulator CreB
MVQPNGKIRILIVEDDALQATMMVQLLSQSGCEVWAVHTGKKGIELAQENQFDLIAVDIGLPDISGFEICKELRQRHISRQTPVVFVSGSCGEEEVQYGLELGAADYITKPFPFDFVRRVLAPITRKASAAYMDTATPTES